MTDTVPPAASPFRLLPLLLAASVSLAAAAHADDGWPKFGPDATPVYESLDYLRKSAVTDYWRMSAVYMAEPTPAGSSVAAAAMAMNMLRGVPAEADEPLITPESLMRLVANRKWAAEVGEGGPGVGILALKEYLIECLRASGLERATMTLTQPTKANQEDLDAFRTALEANETSSRNAMLIHFDRSVVTGDGVGPRVATIGAYDRDNDSVLVMDPDRTWYVPYWTPAATLLVAMLKPAPVEAGALAGTTGGYLVLARP